jgi:hypothetical protein
MVSLGCNREVLSISFVNRGEVEVAKDSENLLIIGSGFSEDTRVTLESDETTSVDIESSLTNTGMLEANLSREVLLKDLEAGKPYDMAVCVQNGESQKCLEEPLSIIVVPIVARPSTTTTTVTTASALAGTGQSSSSASNGTSGFQEPATSTPIAADEGVPSGDQASGPTPTDLPDVLTPTPSPTPSPTLTPTPTPTFTPWPTPTPTRIPKEDAAVLHGGMLNGRAIDPVDPVVVVAPEDTISGRVSVTFDNSHGPGVVFPVGATTSWGDPETSYWQVTSSVKPQASVRYSVSVNVVAPSEPGTYFIVMVGAAENSIAHVMSATRWSAGIPIWDNGDEVAKWSESQIDLVIAGGYLTAPCYPETDFKFGAAAVKVQVED